MTQDLLAQLCYAASAAGALGLVAQGILDKLRDR